MGFLTDWTNLGYATYRQFILTNSSLYFQISRSGFLWCGGKHMKGYVHLVLSPVSKEAKQPSSHVNPNGNGGGLQDIASPQLGLTAGQKHSA